MNSERTLEAAISAKNVRDIAHASLAQFMTAAGLIRNEEDLVDFNFDNFAKGDETIWVKFKIGKEGNGINDEDFSISKK